MARYNPGQAESEMVARKFQGLVEGILGAEAKTPPCQCAKPTYWKEAPGLCQSCGGYIKETEAVSATLPAQIDVQPLEQKLEPERQTFDTILADIREIDPRTIKANMIGRQYAELAAQADATAKAFIDAAKKEFYPAIEKQRAALQAVQDILAKVVMAPQNVRELCKPIQAAYQLAVRQKEEDERREMERRQREQAERERQAELERLRQQAAAEQDAAEKARIEQEAREVQAAPPVPIAVPVAAVAQPRPAGISGTEVFQHGIENWAEFCEMLKTQRPTIEQDQNTTSLRFPGFTAVFNFTGRKKDRQALRGMKVTKSVEVRNRRS